MNYKLEAIKPNFFNILVILSSPNRPIDFLLDDCAELIHTIFTLARSNYYLHPKLTLFFTHLTHTNTKEKKTRIHSILLNLIAIVSYFI